MNQAFVPVAALEERPLVDERVLQIKSYLEAEDYQSVVRALRCAVRVQKEPAHVRRFAALMARIPTDAVEWRRRCRVAILSATTVADRAALLRLFLAADLVGVDVYEGPFGLIDEEILDPASGYNRFAPEITILSPTSQGFAHFEETEPDLDVERWKRLWEAIQGRHRGRVILHALEVPMPSDPSYFVAAVAEGRWFDVPFLGDEDLSRARDYHAARGSQRLLAASGNLEEFLESLELRAEIAAFDTLNLPRIVQLIHRTNQYNLTTRRYSEAEVANLMTTPGVHTRFVRLRDRFSDRGIISVLIAREIDDALEVETWLMSCRVLGRTVEHALLGHVIELGRRLSKTRLLGSYVPSARNALVKDHYARLSFTCLGEDPDGGSRWERAVATRAPRSFVAIARTECAPTSTSEGREGERS